MVASGISCECQPILDDNWFLMVLLSIKEIWVMTDITIQHCLVELRKEERKMAKKYEVTIKESKGSCTKPLFEKMVKNGDITAEKISDVVGKVVKIDGYADCHVVAGEKEFDITYYATTDGLISSGSNVFKQSVLNYMEEDVMCKIMKIKTGKGSTYKVSPILVDDESGEVQSF